MDADDTDLKMQTLVPGTFVALGATMVLMAAVPAAFWFGDVGLLPWSDELRWEELRSQSTQPAAGSLSSDHVSLDRRGCFGPCPTYSVSVFASGRIEFHGLSFVCAKGIQSAQIGGDVANELLGDLESAGFFALTWTPGALIADAPSATTTLVRDGRTHRTERNHGDPHAPRILRRMEQVIDEVAGTARWLPRRIGRDLVCEFADGSRKRVYDLEYPEN
jgi:hypothetical protein